MSLTRIYAILVRQFFLFRSNPIRLASVFLWILLDIILWGFISKYLGAFGAATFNFVNVILGAIILWDFFGRIQQGIMMAFLEDVWTQNFLNLFTSPLRLKEYVAGLVVASLTTGLIGLLLAASLAGLAFGYNIFKVGPAVLLFLVVLFVFGMAMGIFMTAIILRFGPSAEWLGWPIPFIISIFAGVYYPTATLPTALRLISKIIPASYVFENLRHLDSLVFSAASLSKFLINLGLALVYLAMMGIFLFVIYRRSLKNGRLSRFSAET